MAFDTEQHDRILQETLDEIQTGTYDTSKSLETAIADLVTQGLPIEVVRPQIMQTFNEYAQSIRTEALPLTRLSQDYIEQSSVAQTPADLTAQQTLLTLSEDNLSSEVTGHTEDVIQTIVLATVAGVALASLQGQVRGRISGVLMDSSDPVIRRLQRDLRRAMSEGAAGRQITELRRLIRERLPKDIATANSLAVKLSSTVDNSIGSFDGAFAKSRADRMGTERFQYAGGIIETSRPFCKALKGDIMNRDEIDAIWLGQSWAGKEPGDPFVVRGGYNCMHYWVPLEEDGETVQEYVDSEED